MLHNNKLIAKPPRVFGKDMLIEFQKSFIYILTYFI